jgi:hypothetical protein
VSGKVCSVSWTRRIALTAKGHCRSCHPACPERSRRERSDPIFSSAPHHGACGRAARFVRPVRFAGVEGSLFPLFSPLATSLLVIPSNARDLLLVLPLCRPEAALECGSLLPLLRRIPFSQTFNISSLHQPQRRRQAAALQNVGAPTYFGYVTRAILHPTPMFCVSAGIIGVSRRKSEDAAKSEGVERGVCVPDGAPGRSEMAQEQRPSSLCPGCFCGTLSMTEA